MSSHELSGLGRNTVFASLASFLQFGATAIVLVLLTIEFAPAEFGAYVGALGLVFFVAPFAGLGAPSLLHKRINADGFSPDAAMALARGMTMVGGALSVFLVVVLARYLLPGVSSTMVLALAVAELVFIAYLDAVQATVQATETLELSVVLKAAQGATRLVVLCVMLVAVPDPTIESWAWLYLVSAAIAALVAQAVATRHVGNSTAVVAPTLPDAKEGVELTLGWGTERLRSDADKVLLVRFGFGADAGLYGAASRALQLAYVPIRGAVAGSLARFWQGAHQPGKPARLALRLARMAGVYGILTGVAIVLAAPLLPIALGDGYDDTAQILVWLAPLPFLVAMQAFPATALTSEGLNRPRIIIVLSATALNVGLNIVLIPDHGWRGAVGATLFTEVVLAVVLWAALAAHVRTVARAEGAR